MGRRWAVQGIEGSRQIRITAKGASMKSWDKILVGVDKTHTAMHAVQYVGSIIRSLKPPKITLLYVYPEPPPNFYQTGGLLPDYEKEKREYAQDIFSEGRTLLAECGVDSQNIDTVTR
ncbi:MAG: universal stress protein, partial [Desulfobulbaceae bacterium]|nr:universal stress protein [Candidatus Desulfobia pelagia]